MLEWLYEHRTVASLRTHPTTYSLISNMHPTSVFIPVLKDVNLVFCVLFIIELLVRIFAYRARFFIGSDWTDGCTERAVMCNIDC